MVESTDLTTFTQTGFHLALIQKKKDIQSYLNAAWTIGLIRNVILFIDEVHNLAASEAENTSVILAAFEPHLDLGEFKTAESYVEKNLNLAKKQHICLVLLKF